MVFGELFLNRIISFGSDFAYFDNKIFSYTHVLAAFWNSNPILLAAPNKTTKDIVNDILTFDFANNDLVLVQWHTDELSKDIVHCMDYIKNHHHTKKRNFHINTGRCKEFDLHLDLPNNQNNQLLVADKIRCLTTEPS